ncbi:PAS domain S-box protein [Undibacterium sp. Ren11W]|uniref:PAS domain S-box protein n=1 Tax=Undibacterium sp. Ren11W TaxID=3413045 RepID=UPI003BF39888
MLNSGHSIIAAYAKRLRVLALALIFCAAGSASHSAPSAATASLSAPVQSSIILQQAPLDKRVLILVANGFGGRTLDLYVAGLMDGLKKGGIKSGDIYVEYLDLARGTNDLFRQQLARLLTEKYSRIQLDLLFCVQQPSLNFLLNEGKQLAPLSPVFIRGAKLAPGAALGQRQFVSQTAQLDYAGTIQRAMELFPDTTQLVVVQGNSELEQERKKDLDLALVRWRDKLQVTDTTSLSFKEIHSKLSTLPQHSIILGAGFMRDAKGEFFVAAEALGELSRIANAPFFVLYDSMLGSGAVGGMVSRIEEDARSFSQMAVDVLSGATQLSGQVNRAPGTLTPLFDWLQLQRWHADLSKLPANTEFINKPVSLWDHYAAYFIGIVVLILLLCAFVLALIIQNRQRQVAETRYRVLVEQAPEAILVVDFDTKFIIDANPSAEKLLNCTRDELLNSNVRRLYADQQPDGLPVELTRIRNVERALAGESILVERVMRTFDGRELQCDLRLVRLPDIRRRLLRVSLVDVTLRKLAEAQVLQLNRRLQALLDAAQEIAIISTDANGRVTVFNQGAEKMLGYAESEIRGKSPAFLHLTDEVNQRAAFLTQQLGRPIAAFETFVALTRDGASDIQTWTYVRKDGRHLQVSLAVSAVRDEHGLINGFLGIAIDISQRLAAEREFIQLNQELDLRVQERTQALQSSTEQLQQALNHLRQMQDKLVQSEKLAALGSIVAAVAHELNTPIGNCLTVASAFNDKTQDFEKQIHAGQLRRSHLTVYTEDAHNAMQLLLRGLQRAVELVSNFKQVAVDQGSEQRRQFMLKEVADSVVALMSASLQKKNYQIAMRIDHDLNMDSYPGAIEQVIANLINNSVLHGFDGRTHGLIQLQAERDGEHIVLTYGDDGAGMSEDILSHIFDPFFTTRMGTGGSGLGMSICHNLIMGPLGGSIDVSSVPGHGSSFHIILPRVAPKAKDDS